MLMLVLVAISRPAFASEAEALIRQQQEAEIEAEQRKASQPTPDPDGDVFHDSFAEDPVTQSSSPTGEPVIDANNVDVMTGPAVNPNYGGQGAGAGRAGQTSHDSRERFYTDDAPVFPQSPPRPTRAQVKEAARIVEQAMEDQPKDKDRDAYVTRKVWEAMHVNTRPAEQLEAIAQKEATL